MKITLKSAELVALLEGAPGATPEALPGFPKYATKLINLANQNAQGTRAKIVGQQTQLIEEFPGETIKEWQAWYLERYPDALSEASQKIYAAVLNLKGALDQIDYAMVEQWVRDLVLVKTFVGLKFQAAILRRVAQEKGEPFRASTVEEESRGVDGFIGERAVSIKPHTYRAAAMLLSETIAADIIYYQKRGSDLMIEFDF